MKQTSVVIPAAKPAECLLEGSVCCPSTLSVFGRKHFRLFEGSKQQPRSENFRVNRSEYKCFTVAEPFIIGLGVVESVTVVVDFSGQTTTKLF